MLVITLKNITNKDSSVVVHNYCSYCMFVSTAEGSEREQQYTRSYSGFGESYEEMVWVPCISTDCSLMCSGVCVCVQPMGMQPPPPPGPATALSSSEESEDEGAPIAPENREEGEWVVG